MYPAECHTGVNRGFLVLIDIVEHHGRVEVLADVVGAFLAVLPSPGGVVQVVAGEVEHFLHRGFAVGIPAWVAPCGECYRMVLVEFLLGRDEKAAGVVESAGHHAFVGISPDGADGECQPVLLHAGGVGCHGTVFIVRVGVAQGSVESGGIAFCDGVEVLASADCAEPVG